MENDLLAFPLEYTIPDGAPIKENGRFIGNAVGEQHFVNEGMTLRDYFAAKAMQMLRADLRSEWDADRAYEMADAMLEARKK